MNSLYSKVQEERGSNAEIYAEFANNSRIPNKEVSLKTSSQLDNSN